MIIENTYVAVFDEMSLRNTGFIYIPCDYDDLQKDLKSWFYIKTDIYVNVEG